MNKKRIAQIRAYLTFSLAALLLCIPLSGKAQTARLDLHLKQAPLKQAMSEIERQTSYRFVPNIEIDIEYPVSVYAENEPLKTVLDRLFAATPYTYSFLNSTTTILLSKRPQEQPAAVSGLVVDARARRSAPRRTPRAVSASAYRRPRRPVLRSTFWAMLLRTSKSAPARSSAWYSKRLPRR